MVINNEQKKPNRWLFANQNGYESKKKNDKELFCEEKWNEFQIRSSNELNKFEWGNQSREKMRFI